MILELLEKSVIESRTIAPERYNFFSKYMDLVMRCTWKITKLIPSLVKESDFSAEDLIFDFHSLLTSIPPSEWKKLSSESPMPQIDIAFKTIKTMLLELVSCYKELIFDHMGRLSDPSSSNVIVMIKAMVDSDRKKQGLPAYEDERLLQIQLAPRARTAISNLPRISPISTKIDMRNIDPSSPLRRALSTPDHSKHAKHLGESELNAELGFIFQKISNKDITKEGIQELYTFQKIHTYADALVESHLSKTGQYFQGYIRRGLANLMEEEHSAQVKLSVVEPLAPIAKVNADPYKEKLYKLQRMFVNDSTEGQNLANINKKMGGLVGVEMENVEPVEVKQIPVIFLNDDIFIKRLKRS